MTLPVSRPRKHVVLSDTNEKILEDYHQTLKLVFSDGSGAIPGKFPEAVEQDTAVLGQNNVARERWWVPVADTINKAFSAITGINPFDTKQYILHPFVVELSKEASDVFTGYEDYITQLFDHYNRSVKQRLGDKISGKTKAQITDKDEISADRGYILVREIFIRIAALALSEGFIDTRDGDKLLKVAAMFQNKLLLNKRLATNDALSGFEQELGTIHREKLKALLSVVAVIKGLNANKDAISRAQRFIDEAKYTLMTHIILILGPDLKDPSCITQKVRIRETFIAIEKDYLSQSTLKLEGAERNIAITKQLLDRYKQQPPANTIGTLSICYELLNQADNLGKLLSGLEDLQKIAGWIPVLCGGLNLVKVADKISEFGINLNRATDVIDPSDFRVKHALSRTIIANQTQFGVETVEGINWQSIAAKLKHLTDMESRQLIAHVSCQAVTNIIQAQHLLDISVMDDKNLTLLFPSAFQQSEVITGSKRLALPTTQASSALPLSLAAASAEPQQAAAADTTARLMTAFSDTNLPETVASDKARTPAGNPITAALKTVQDHIKNNCYVPAINILKTLVDHPDITANDKLMCRFNLASLVLAHADKLDFSNKTGLDAKAGFESAKIASAGHFKAFLLLADAYENGKGTEINKELALASYKKFIELGTAKNLSPDKLAKAQQKVTELNNSQSTPVADNTVPSRAATFV